MKKKHKHNWLELASGAVCGVFNQRVLRRLILMATLRTYPDVYVVEWCRCGSLRVWVECRKTPIVIPQGVNWPMNPLKS